MARRPTRRQMDRLEALLDQFSEDIRDAFLAVIQDISGSVTLSRLTNAIERAYIAGSWAASDAATIAANAIDSVRMQAVIAAMNLEYGFYRPFEEAIRRAFLAGGDSGIEDLPTLRNGDGARVVIRFNVRSPSAETWLSEHSSGLITRMLDEQRELVRNALVDGLVRGQNPRTTALQLVGRLDRVSGQRTGGLVGLSRPQERTVSWVRQALADNDPEALRKYLGLKMRDRRFDKMVMRAIDGEKLSVESSERIAGRLSDRYLKLRGDTIGRTESLASLNAGRNESFAQAVEAAGIDQQHVTRVWSATMDGRTRDTHRSMNGQTVRGTNTPFTTPSGARMMYPGDQGLGAPASEVVACRCFLRLSADPFEGRGGE